MRRVAVAAVGGAVALALTITGCVAPSTMPSPASPTAVAATSAAPTPTPTKAGTPTAATSTRIQFSDPWSTRTAARFRLHRTQVAAIKAAPAGATIHLVMYTFATDWAGQALLAAHRRGVNVRVIIDDHENYRWTKRLQAALGTDQHRRSYVVRCHLACASDMTYPRRRSAGTIRSYVHAKWLIIDRSGTDHDVVMIPSENLTPAAAEQSNDLMVLRGNHAAYSFLRARFDIMRKDAGTAYGTVTSGSVTMTMFPMPLPEDYKVKPDEPLPAAMDPYLDYLRDIQCGGDHSTTIRIAMYMWTYPRLEVAKRFAELARAGCRVIAIGQPLSAETDEGWDPEITRTLLDAGIKLHQTAGGVYLHSKIVTLEGWTTSGARLHLAVTGSSNFLLQALVASDDLIVTDSDLAVVSAYSAHVDQLIARHSRPVH
ncbi:MAG TPA: phospholipase D-like domain-containing protein [Propionicimonas sp.]|nr:phospholipase D-like domain-containing protein [Propionicimonas sp.]